MNAKGRLVRRRMVREQLPSGSVGSGAPPRGT